MQLAILSAGNNAEYLFMKPIYTYALQIEQMLGKFYDKKTSHRFATRTSVVDLGISQPVIADEAKSRYGHSSSRDYRK